MSEKYVCDDRTVIEELQMIRNMSDEEFEQYAEEHLMAVNHFIISFKNIMKMTPMQYIMSLRITATKGYFGSTNKNIWMFKHIYYQLFQNAL